MQKNDGTVREPLIHITKRGDVSRARGIRIRAVAILAALLVCGLIIWIMTGLNPLDVYKTMIEGSFSTPRKVWVLMQNTSMLLIVALAVTPAFKMRFWNLGAEGQVLASALAAAAVMFYVRDSWPGWLLTLAMFAASVIAGVIWAGIPAFFKATFGTNETLFTLMMNYVAIQLVAFCIAVWVPSGSSVLGVMNMNSEKGWLPSLFGQRYLINILAVLLLTVFMFIYLRYSKQGYEIAVIGESENTARYVGISVRRVIIRTVAISGALAGVAGFLLVSGSAHTVSTTLAGGNGFTAVLVSWLAKFNPLIMIFTSMLLMFLKKGAGEIAQVYRLSDNVSEIVTGILLFFIIGCEFFINYKINFRKKAAVTEEAGAAEEKESSEETAAAAESGTEDGTEKTDREVL